MNSKERIEAVVALETPDRVPVGPLLDHFAATYAGITNAELMQNGDQRIAAVLKTMSELGPWDITFAADTANAVLLKVGVPARVRLPGKELNANEIHQFEEFQFLSPEDYDFLKNRGFLRFMISTVGRLYPEDRGLRGLREFALAILELRRHRKLVEKAGAELACGFIIIPFFDYFSMGRSLAAMSLDLYDRPESLKAASKIWTRSYTSLAIYCAKFVGAPRVFIGLSRCSPTLISPRHFEEFVLPDLEVGVSYTTRSRTVTEADIVNFAGVTGDFNELHMSEEYAAKTPFGKRIAHEALGPLQVFLVVLPARRFRGLVNRE